ncbi:flagellar motor protein MotB [Dongia sp.]|jgi:chemotaxis protein MotB|uniref:flagellar motor protein MotB n=1 Tax=Dongia sp. TaxID=1977262 RepID=UPI0035AE9356
MADERPIIIKRIKKSGGGHHGGAWKVAYADFVTAMMAFFLLLWLLGNTTDEQKKAIGNYFSPTLSVSDAATTVAVMDGQTQVMETTSGGAAAEVDVEEDGTGQTGDGTGASDQEAPVAAAQGEKPIDAQEAEAALKAEETKKFEEVKKQIQQVIAQTPDLSGLQDNLKIDQTPEGLRIQLLDKEKESMFASGSAQMADKSRQLLALVAQAVKGMPNKLAISGHTDAAPFVGAEGRTNWELSSDRANAARRVLVENGIDPSHVSNVVGRADTDPFVKENPNDPQNRRISIVLLSEVHLNPGEGAAAQPATPPTPAEPAGPPAEIVPPAATEPGSGG